MTARRLAVSGEFAAVATLFQPLLDATITLEKPTGALPLAERRRTSSADTISVIRSRGSREQHVTKNKAQYNPRHRGPPYQGICAALYGSLEPRCLN